MVVFSCAYASPSLADPASSAVASSADRAARARSLRDEGAELARQGLYAQAAAALRESWAMQEDPATAGLLGASELRLGGYRAAAEHLALALRAQTEEGERAQLEALFRQAQAKVGHLEVTVNVPKATVIVGDFFVRDAPLEGGVFVEPGEVVVIAKKAGVGEVQQKVSVAAGASQRVDLRLVSEGPPSFLGEPPRSLLPAYIIGGVAVAGAAVGASLLVAGMNKQGDADAALASLESAYGPAPCAAGGARPVACDDLKSARESSDDLVNSGAFVLVGAGAVLSAAVVYGVMAQSPPSRRTGDFFMAPRVSSAGGGVWMQGQF